MTLKTSFFNKGIYKLTVKRYIWGAVLYFAVLFMSTGLSLFLNIDRDFSHMPYDYFKDYSVILHGSYIGIPIALAIIVTLKLNPASFPACFMASPNELPLLNDSIFIFAILA